MKKAERIALLLFKRATSNITADEEEELQQWADQSNENRQLFQRWQNKAVIEETVADYRLFCEQIKEVRADRETPEATGNIAKRQKIKAVVGIAALLVITWCVWKWFLPGNDTPQQPSIAIIPVWRQLSVKKGAQRDTVLSDGTRIWVNTNSALQYPEVFTGQERLVLLNGEAYFEVAEDSIRPFIVRVREGNRSVDIQVMGTHFNVRAYGNEPLNATVLEGKVNLSSSRGSAGSLTAGQQLLMDSMGAIQRFSGVDTDQVMAWKDNYFDFKKTSVQDMLGEFARWYDIKVVYQDTIREEFYARVSRSMTLPQVLNVLENNNKMELELHGKTLIVKAPGKNQK